jgi:hypothetical protein
MQDEILKQNKFSFLVDALSAQVCQIISTEENIALTAAIEKFYSSKTFDLLNDRDTLLYLQSSSYLYEMYSGR